MKPWGGCWLRNSLCRLGVCCAEYVLNSRFSWHKYLVVCNKGYQKSGHGHPQLTPSFVIQVSVFRLCRISNLSENQTFLTSGIMPRHCFEDGNSICPLRVSTFLEILGWPTIAYIIGWGFHLHYHVHLWF